MGFPEACVRLPPSFRELRVDLLSLPRGHAWDEPSRAATGPVLSCPERWEEKGREGRGGRGEGEAALLIQH